jgi:cellulose biosynthesis protein BcsQ
MRRRCAYGASGDDCGRVGVLLLGGGAASGFAARAGIRAVFGAGPEEAPHWRATEVTVSENRPLTLAIVSGKGGVGKTMLAAAIARELSRASRTLLVDLDFFNRGLTGLLQTGKEVQIICKPDFLAQAETAEEEKWRILEVEKNLYHVSYPDLTEEDMRKFESSDVQELRRSLEAFILEAAEKCACNCVVMDCHGGPDNSSFAACLFADHALLISEPDRITFYGTLNFMRQLKRATKDEHPDVHLVFNKVVPAFSALFLQTFYRKHLREEFGGRPLLAIFPLEVYLTKEFEKTPFLTSVYPTSLLARKTQVLLYDLLNARHKTLLPAPVRNLPSWTRQYRQLTLGKQFFLFDLNLLMLLIVTGFVIAAVLSGVVNSTATSGLDRIPRLRSLAGTLMEYVTLGGTYMAAWFPVTLLIAWSKLLDTRFIYAWRTRHRLSAIAIFLASLLLWLPFTLVLGGFSKDTEIRLVWLVFFLCAVSSAVILEQVIRVYRGFRYEHHPVEYTLRLVFLGYLASLPFFFRSVLPGS